MTDIFDQEFRKAPHHTKHESASGVRISPGPYVGIVKNNTDPLRSGKLQVWIPELGGSPTDEGSWKTVSYSTPFYGVTNHRDTSGYAGHPHSYGMWFVPPDIGIKVLCTFANGNPFDGYWFACVPEWPNMYNLPGMAASLDGSIPSPVTNGPTDTLTPAILSNIGPLKDQSGNNLRIAHDYQKATWDAQHLTNDPDRGPGTSSAFRETPSSVFGISTPGQPIDSSDPQLKPNVNGDQEWGVRGRKGGHTFVMDDGDSKGKNQMFRLRSSKGHMILMNDTKDFIYVINSKGTAWVEINAAGDINMYSQSNVNIKAKGGMQLETDGALKLHGKTVDIVSDGAFNMQGTDINILGSGKTKVTGKSALHLKGNNTYLTGDSCIQIKADGHIDLKAACHTINTADATKAEEAGAGQKPSNMPTNEPWTGHNSPTAPTSQPAFGQTQGLPGAATAGIFSAANNFGSNNVQQNYGPMTNNIPPTTYTNSATNFAGQGSTAGNYTSSTDSSGTSYIVAGAIAGAVAGIAYGSGASFDVSSISPENNSDPNFTTGELQNNPGNLPYSSNDQFAVGYANSIAVYTKPENGIAALAVLFDSFNTSTTTMCIDLITKFLNAKSNQDPNVINMTRYMNTNLGISATDHVALSDPTTRLGWVATVIKYVQNGLIYTYDQLVSGCALSLNISKTTFLNGLQPVTQPWQNNGGTNPYSGFVNPATTPNVQNNGNSPLTQIATGIINNIVSGAAFSVGNSIGSSVGNYLTGSSNSPSNAVSSAVNSATSNLGLATGQSAYTSYLGQSVGSGQCVALVQAASGAGTTSTWVPGTSVTSGTLQPGTVIATFGSDGTYQNISGQSHAAIFLGYQYDQNGNVTGIQVQDQWSGQPCGTRVIPYGTGTPESGENFVAVTHDGSTPIQAAGSPQPITQDQVNNLDGNVPLPPTNPDSVSGNNPTSANNVDNYDNSGYRDMSATGSASSSTDTSYLPIENSNAAYTSASSPTSADNAYNYSQTDNSYLPIENSSPSYISASSPTSADNVYNYSPTPDTSYLPIENPNPASVSASSPTSSNNYYNASQPVVDTTPNRDPIANPDSAAYGDNYSSTVVNAPTNTPTTAVANPGDIATGGVGTGNNQSDTGSVIDSAQSTSSSAGTAATNVANPGDIAGGGFGSGSSGGSTQPITGTQAAPATGGQTGAQSAPGGSSSTGAGGKSC